MKFYSSKNILTWAPYESCMNMKTIKAKHASTAKSVSVAAHQRHPLSFPSNQIPAHIDPASDAQLRGCQCLQDKIIQYAFNFYQSIPLFQTLCVYIE